MSAALKRHYKDIRLQAKDSATPENMDVINATVMRLEALLETVKPGRQQEGQRAHTWLSGGQVRTLVSVPQSRTSRRDKIVLALLVQTGLRRDEAVNLRWRDIVQAGEGWQLSVTGKGDKARAVPITNEFHALMEAWRQFCEAQPDERVLRGLASGARLSPGLTGAQLFNIVRKHGRRIGKDELAPHDLRRTYAQTLRSQGIDIAVISRLLGHASVDTTMRYLNVEIGSDAVVHLPL